MHVVNATRSPTVVIVIGITTNRIRAYSTWLDRRKITVAVIEYKRWPAITKHAIRYWTECAPSEWIY